MAESSHDLPKEHQDFLDSLDPAARAVYNMSKTAGYNIIKRMGAEHERNEALHAATHDDLTGLLNKKAWKSNLNQRIAEAERTGKSLGILFIDLKDFKRLNDRHGHSIGDQVIVYSAEVLKATLREKDRDNIAHERMFDSGDKDAGRMGGDEFAVIIDLTPRDGEASTTPQDRLDSICERVREIFHSAPEIKDTGVGISVGSAIWEPGMTGESLLISADQSMYDDKNTQINEQGSYR